MQPETGTTAHKQTVRTNTQGSKTPCNIAPARCLAAAGTQNLLKPGLSLVGEHHPLPSHSTPAPRPSAAKLQLRKSTQPAAGRGARRAARHEQRRSCDADKQPHPSTRTANMTFSAIIAGGTSTKLAVLEQGAAAHSPSPAPPGTAELLRHRATLCHKRIAHTEQLQHALGLCRAQALHERLTPPHSQAPLPSMSPRTPHPSSQSSCQV